MIFALAHDCGRSEHAPQTLFEHGRNDMRTEIFVVDRIKDTDAASIAADKNGVPSAPRRTKLNEAYHESHEFSTGATT
jgi:hypothetical protein